jgi:hypothetical protein
MKETYVSYCQVCHKDFTEGQKVYFVPIDNNIVCKECADKANTEIQPRVHKK